VAFPPARRAIVDFLRVGRQKPFVHGLIEVDVTYARRRLREHREATGEKLSFTAFVTKCVAQAVEENRWMQAYRRGNRLVLFDDVDVALPVEREFMGHAMGVVYVLRAANRKTFRQIHDEIRAAQSTKPEETEQFRRVKWLFLLPAFVRRLMWGLLLGSPAMWKRFGGTVGVTAIGMFGQGTGWGIPLPVYTLNIAVGGIAEKPGAVGGEIGIREYLCLTISMDHDIIDGAPAARFTRRLKELVESGFGLTEGLGAG
jgi:pyruvate/2-oxoglutarate dehydrogenase complex dihydrolipoamide acyltransferase (E2) component